LDVSIQLLQRKGMKEELHVTQTHPSAH
jgi:hypothetical protein